MIIYSSDIYKVATQLSEITDKASAEVFLEEYKINLAKHFDVGPIVPLSRLEVDRISRKNIMWVAGLLGLEHIARLEPLFQCSFPGLPSEIGTLTIEVVTN